MGQRLAPDSLGGVGETSAPPHLRHPSEEGDNSIKHELNHVQSTTQDFPDFPDLQPVSHPVKIVTAQATPCPVSQDQYTPNPLPPPYPCQVTRHAKSTEEESWVGTADVSSVFDKSAGLDGTKVRVRDWATGLQCKGWGWACTQPQPRPQQQQQASKEGREEGRTEGRQQQATSGTWFWKKVVSHWGFLTSQTEQEQRNLVGVSFRRTWSAFRVVKPRSGPLGPKPTRMAGLDRSRPGNGL